MAFLTDDELLYEAMDPCQFMFWDKEDRPYFYMRNYDDSDSDSEAIPGSVLSQIVKSQKARQEAKRSIKEPQPCKFFQWGSCRYGGECRFRHASASNMERETDKCIFFQRGFCRYGNSCHFKHTISNNNESHSSSKKPAQNETSYEKHSDFSPSAEDVSAGRLTRIRVCFELPVSGSVPWEKPNNHRSYFIEVFVDKRDDDVQYLYDIVEKKVNHPLYGPGMFQLHKPGTSLDLSDKTQKLKETSVFIFGSCVDAQLIQSFATASKLLENEKLCDPQRYQMSALPRNGDGSFTPSDLQTKLKTYPLPTPKELSIKVDQIIFSSVSDNEIERQASFHQIEDIVGKRLRVHSKESCSWCSDKGCQCLSNVDDIDSDDSELSYHSKTSDTRQDSKSSSSNKDRFDCGSYPECLSADSIPDNIHLSFGDIISFGEYPKAAFYVLGTASSLMRLQSEDFIHIPLEISCHLKDPVKKYSRIINEFSSRIGDTMAVCVGSDDASLQHSFGGSLPSKWQCFAVLRHGSSKTDVDVHHYRIYVDEDHFFDAVTTNSQLASDGYYVTKLDEILQR